jgi:hypothetical protein
VRAAKEGNRKAAAKVEKVAREAKARKAAERTIGSVAFAA